MHLIDINFSMYVQLYYAVYKTTANILTKTDHSTTTQYTRYEMHACMCGCSKHVKVTHLYVYISKVPLHKKNSLKLLGEEEVNENNYINTYI